MTVKTVLCFGDSNTWGYNAATESRYPLAKRWTSVLARELGEGYLVIPEGLNGRTTVWPDPVEGEYKSGKSYLTACLESHHPLDLVVIMLGTNDLKHRFGLSAWDIAHGAATLVEIVQASTFGAEGRPPRVLLIAPPPTCVAGTRFAEMFGGSDEISSGLGPAYALVAAELGCSFLDAGAVITSSTVDGIHFDEDALPVLGKAVATSARAILG
jgi:lysophospholipase L1-like esterase